MEELKKLYYDYTGNNPDKFALGDMPETEEAMQKFEELTEQLNEKDSEELQYAALGIASVNEMQGWVYGFQYAMRLMMACGVKGGVNI